MAHARRANAGLGEPIVEPRSRAVAEVGADRLVHRRQDLQQHEDGARQDEGCDEGLAALDGSDQRTHRDRENRWQHAAQDEHGPPSRREHAVRLRQHAEELVFVPVAPSGHGDCLSVTTPKRSRPAGAGSRSGQTRGRAHATGPLLRGARASGPSRGFGGGDRTAPPTMTAVRRDDRTKPPVDARHPVRRTTSSAQPQDSVTPEPPWP